VAVENTRTLASRLQGWIEQLFPNWTHRRHRHRWERQWLKPEFSPFWKTDQPQKELVDAIESGWFPKNQRVIDVGCGNGEVSRWLAGQGFAVLGLDYSAAAIENCRRLSAGHPNAPIFEVADLCDEDLRLEPAFSLIDRGCFHRIVGNRPQAWSGLTWLMPNHLCRCSRCVQLENSCSMQLCRRFANFRLFSMATTL